MFGWHDVGIWIWTWVIKIQIFCLDSLQKVKDLNLINPPFYKFKTIEFEITPKINVFEIKAFQIY